MSDYLEMPIPIDVSKTAFREALFQSYREDDAVYDVIKVEVSEIRDFEAAMSCIEELSQSLAVDAFKNAFVTINSELKRDAWRLHRKSFAGSGVLLSHVVVGSDGA